jgi:hypothetical protein
MKELSDQEELEEFRRVTIFEGVFIFILCLLIILFVVVFMTPPGGGGIQ